MNAIYNLYNSCFSFTGTQGQAHNQWKTNRTLLKVLGVSAAAAIISPAVRMGACAGLATGCTVPLFAKVLQKFWPQFPQASQAYQKHINSEPFTVILTGPIFEEVIYRGAVQSAVGPIPAALVSGAIHLRKGDDLSKLQALVTTIYGIGFGLLSERYGLGAAIGAHIIHNTIVNLLRTNP